MDEISTECETEGASVSLETARIEISSHSQVSTEELERALECQLCLLTVCEPISTPCGHTFCKVCLVKALRRSQKKCPTCRSVCHINPEDAQVNIMVKSIAMAINQAAYISRLQEIEIEKATWNTVLPIFYYNQALFPGCKLSLHLFEPRYKIMMQRIINTSRSFAYVPNYTNYSASCGDIALIAQLEEAEFLSDGRCLLDAKMTSRCVIVDHFVEQGTQGLHFCRLDPYKDDPIPADEMDIMMGYKTIALRMLFTAFDSATRVQIESRYGSEPSDISVFSLWLTALTPSPESEKARWLKSRNTKSRLQHCIEVMTALIGSYIVSTHTLSEVETETEDENEDSSMVQEDNEHA